MVDCGTLSKPWIRVPPLLTVLSVWKGGNRWRSGLRKQLPHLSMCSPKWQVTKTNDWMTYSNYSASSAIASRAQQASTSCCMQKPTTWSPKNRLPSGKIGRPKTCLFTYHSQKTMHFRSSMTCPRVREVRLGNKVWKEVLLKLLTLGITRHLLN